MGGGFGQEDAMSAGLTLVLVGAAIAAVFITMAEMSV